MRRAIVDETRFNPDAHLPFELRTLDFRLAMQDAYDFLFDVNEALTRKGLPRLEESVRGAIFSGLLSELLSASVAKHSRSLVENSYPNGHPDLLRRGAYPNDMVQSGQEGVEVKVTRKRGGAVDVHGPRNQWMAVFVYELPTPTDREAPLLFREIYLGQVGTAQFRRNPRGELGTRTATLDAAGIAGLRRSWVYLDLALPVGGRRRADNAAVR
jgi:hypothetical protein